MLDRKTHLDEMVKRMNALEEEVDQLKSELAKVHVLIKKKNNISFVTLKADGKCVIPLGPVVYRVDNSIQQIN